MTQRLAHGMSGWHFLGWLGLHRQTKFQVPISCLVVVVVVSRINLQNVNHWPGKLNSYFYHQLWHHLVLLRLAQGLVKNPCGYSFPVGFLQNVTKLWTLFGHIFDKCPIMDFNLVTFWTSVQNLDTYLVTIWTSFQILDIYLVTFWTSVQILDTSWTHFGKVSKFWSQFWTGVQTLATFWARFGHILDTFVQNVSILTSFMST